MPDPLTMAGLQRTRNSITHGREFEILNNYPNNCDEFKAAIRDLEETIKWRKGDLNPLEKGTQVYVNHVKRIRELEERRVTLRRYAKEEGCGDCK